MEKPNSIINLEALNKIKLTETNDLVFSKQRGENTQNVYKLNQNKEVIALNLCNNGLKNIQGISLLQNLEELYLEGNHIEDLYFINYNSKLKILNVSNNLLNDNTINISIHSLEKLYLDNNNLSRIPNSANWPNLKILSLSLNNISQIYSFPYLKLEELSLNNNKIDIIQGLEVFTNLKRLNLGSNKISVIQNLNIKSLESLDLYSNHIKKLENLENLSNLKSLIISNNSIERIERIFNENLTFLDLSYNKITFIEGLSKLKNIVFLNLQGNNISIIEGLNQLMELEYLFLGINQVTSLKGLTGLKKLRSVYMSSNLISKIEGIENLKNLSNLDLSLNLITHIEDNSELINLTSLNISNNQIEDLKDCEQLLNLKKLKQLKIHDNPFLVREGILLHKDQDHLDTLKNELEKLEKEKKEIRLPVKVMLLGNHASGKSTFLDYFFTDEIKNKSESTHILKIVNYPRYYKRRQSRLPNIIFYDFGGQDYYHGVYQAFLTLNTINLLFWQDKTDSISREIDSKKEKIINFDKQYWLQQIDFANSQRRKYSVDITEEVNYTIQTHSDSSGLKNLTQGNIKQTFFVSLLENHNSKKNEFALKYLKESIKEEIRLHSKLVKKTKNEIDLYRYISEYKKEDWIEVKDLTKIYKSSLGNLKAELEQLSMNGMVLYYKNIPSLENYVWLNPSLTVEKIHEILSIQKTGRIEKKEFERKINDDKIIDMLKENKVIFFDDYDNYYIVPGYLEFAHEENEEFFYFAEYDSPNFILKFLNFIPFGFINQLICHFGKNPHKKVYWRNQLIFTQPNARIRIKINFELLEIRVFVISSKNALLKDIEREIFIEILYLYWDESIPTLEDIKTQEKIFEDTRSKNYHDPINLMNKKESIFEKIIDDLYISLDRGNSYIKHSVLQTLEKRSLTINTYNFAGGIINDSGVTQVTNFKNFTNNINIKAMKKIFISYSRKDGEFKDELKKHLNMLKLFDIADNWSCEQITIGNWHNQIQKELEESDLIIYMLSKNFFNSKYILEQEVQKGMEQMDSNSKKKILGVVVGSFPSLDLLKASSSDRDSLQDSILRLGENQYLPYGNISNNASGLTENKIIPLDIYSKVCIDGNLDTAFQQIAEKISNELK